MRLIPSLDFLVAPAAALWSGGLVLAQRMRPLRTRVALGPTRAGAQLGLGLAAAAITRALVLPGLLGIARRGTKYQWGVLPRLLPPGPLRLVTSLAALDCAMYLWHRSCHQWPLLWRLHRVHHADLGLDLSTAVRIHPVELLASIAARGLWVALLGASPSALLAYEALVQLCTLFHHSNLDLGAEVDACLAHVLMTPRLHTRHHAANQAERDCNWGVVSSLWDRCFGSLVLTPARDRRLGVDELRQELGLTRLLRLPFQRLASA
jgi:sterol desaturase/sphingolipid hydroxylase (fatty acid hydroxylase superfamily)